MVPKGSAPAAHPARVWVWAAWRHGLWAGHGFGLKPLCTALCTALCNALAGALDAARNTRGADIGSVDSGIVDRGRAAGTTLGNAGATLCNAGTTLALGAAATLALLALTVQQLVP